MLLLHFFRAICGREKFIFKLIVANGSKKGKKAGVANVDGEKSDKIDIHCRFIVDNICIRFECDILECVWVEN
jgi:hypothetical protein